MLRILEEVIPGLKVNGENLNNIRYANYTVLMAAASKGELHRLLDISVEESGHLGLSLNVK